MSLNHSVTVLMTKGSTDIWDCQVIDIDGLDISGHPIEIYPKHELIKWMKTAQKKLKEENEILFYKCIPTEV